jgi:DeoR/GlpR family transcriptional regulator of sugar metabolism
VDDARKMGRRDRRDKMVSYLRSDGRVSVAELARDFGVTASTIRRDLSELADDGWLIRTYGGATVANRRSAALGDDAGRAAKAAVAGLAATLVSDGQAIAIGSGTTALEFARRVGGRRLTVITNALDVANVLVDSDGIELIILGGVVRPRMHSMLGHVAELAARELRADTLFMGIGAISLNHGLMNDSVPEILTDRALREMARSTVILADSSKFERAAPAYVFDLRAGDTIVTDDRILAATRAGWEQRGVRVLTAATGAGTDSAR